MIKYVWSRALDGSYNARPGHDRLKVWRAEGAWHGSLNGRLVTGHGYGRKSEAARVVAFAYWQTQNLELRAS